jgi:hypothetical protein
MRMPMLAAALVLAAPITSCDRSPASSKDVLTSTGRARPGPSGEAPKAARSPAPGTGAVASDAETQAQTALPAYWSDPA